MQKHYLSFAFENNGIMQIKKVDLSMYYWYSKRKLGATMHFSEMILKLKLNA